MTPASVAIIGGGLGGLSAAIYLSTAGYAVSLFESNDRVGGRASRISMDGFHFDTGPSLLNYPWVFEDLFQTAGKNLYDYVTLIPVDPSIRFQWPDGVDFTLSSRLDRLIDACERIEPGVRPRALAYLGDAQAKYTLTFKKLINRNEDSLIPWLGRLSLSELLTTGLWRSMDRELGRFFKSRYLREAFGSYAMYLGGTPYELPGIFSMLPYGELAHGLWLPEGGIYGLIEGVERLALELGAQIHTGCPVTRIQVTDNKVVGLTLADGRRLPFSHIVSNVDAPTTMTALLPEDTARRRISRVRRMRMTPGVITFYWGVEGKLPALGHHTIFMPDHFRTCFDDLLKKRRIPDDLAFYVSLPSETDPTLAPDGHTAMFVLVPTPPSDTGPEKIEGGCVDRIRDRVIQRLIHHGIVFCPERIILERVYTPEDWKNLFGLYNGSAFGLSHTFWNVGPFRPANKDPEIRGLYYTGASTTPGTGLPMVVLSGRLTAWRLMGEQP